MPVTANANAAQIAEPSPWRDEKQPVAPTISTAMRDMERRAKAAGVTLAPELPRNRAHSANDRVVLEGVVGSNDFRTVPARAAEQARQWREERVQPSGPLASFPIQKQYAALNDLNDNLRRRFESGELSGPYRAAISPYGKLEINPQRFDPTEAQQAVHRSLRTEVLQAATIIEAAKRISERHNRVPLDSLQAGVAQYSRTQVEQIRRHVENLTKHDRNVIVGDERQFQEYRRQKGEQPDARVVAALTNPNPQAIAAILNPAKSPATRADTPAASIARDLVDLHDLSANGLLTGAEQAGIKEGILSRARSLRYEDQQKLTAELKHFATWINPADATEVAKFAKSVDAGHELFKSFEQLKGQPMNEATRVAKFHDLAREIRQAKAAGADIDVWIAGVENSANRSAEGRARLADFTKFVESAERSETRIPLTADENARRLLKAFEAAQKNNASPDAQNNLAQLVDSLTQNEMKAAMEVVQKDWQRYMRGDIGRVQRREEFLKFLEAKQAASL